MPVRQASTKADAMTRPRISVSVAGAPVRRVEFRAHITRCNAPVSSTEKAPTPKSRDAAQMFRAC